MFRKTALEVVSAPDVTFARMTKTAEKVNALHRVALLRPASSQRLLGLCGTTKGTILHSSAAERRRLVEAAGIEPASEKQSPSAPTSVAHGFVSHRRPLPMGGIGAGQFMLLTAPYELRGGRASFG